MQSFFAKCTAVGIVAGGFAVTGDLGRLADRGRRLLEARTVPSETAPSLPAEAPVLSRTPPTSRAPGVAVPEIGGPPSREAAADAPVGRAVPVPVPPASGPESIDLSGLSAGRCVLVWVTRPATPGRVRSIELVALDVIDAASGEALEHRHAAISGSGRLIDHASPRRVVVGGQIAGSQAVGRIVKAAPLWVVPLQGISGPGKAENLGTVEAIELANR